MTGTWGGQREGAGRPKGVLNQNTRARREAARAVVARFEIEHPDAFPGDAVGLLQCIYRDQSLPLEVRLDAASKAAPFERPRLSAVAVQPVARARVDLSVLDQGEQAQLAALL